MSKVYEVVKRAKSKQAAQAGTEVVEPPRVSREDRSPDMPETKWTGQAGTESLGPLKTPRKTPGMNMAEVKRKWQANVGKLVEMAMNGGQKQAAHREETIFPQDTGCSDEDRQNAGWVSHDYTQSRKVELNMRLCAENRCVALLPGAQEMDYYRVLRTHILHKTANGNGNTIMITSALPGEGKTITSVNLALALAKDFHKTALLADCDLRRQNVHKLLGIQGEKGLIDYLLNDTPVSELILWPGIDKLTIISGGRPFPESTELLGSAKMKNLVADMKNRYPERYVLFDAPPLLSGADAIAMTPLVDHVLFVVQAGKTSIHDVEKAVSLIPREKILGIVLNQAEVPSDAGYYRYGA